MLESRRFEWIAVICIGVVLLLTTVAVIWPESFDALTQEQESLQYPEKMFGQPVIEMDIAMNEDDWDTMIENKMTKEYRSCDLTINGETFSGVGIRTKGNSSLSNVQGERLSFRFDFDHYVYHQTYYGLEQMVVNNLQADATYMKDYVAYDLMSYMGVQAPLHTFVFLTVNGEPFGVYLAVEVYESDYLERTEQDPSTRLYNVKSSGFNTYESAEVDPETAEVISTKGFVEASGQGMGGMPPPPPGGMDQPGEMPPPLPGGMVPPGDGDGETAPQLAAPNQGGEQAQSQPTDEDGQPGPGQQPPEPPGGAGGGGDLVYTDNQTESYPYIFANAVFEDTTAADYARVIRAIYVLNQEGVMPEELEQYWDVDEILRYFAVHTFMVNSDSYTGSMTQNYYLAELDGKVSVLPWDYNLSFGAMEVPGGNGHGGAPPGGPPAGGGGVEAAGKLPEETGEAPAEQERLGTTDSDQATAVINFAIDTPVFSVSMEERPLLSSLLRIDEYREKYHSYLSQLSEYASNDFLEKLRQVEEAIFPYVQQETEAFFTAEQQYAGAAALQRCIVLRSQSIQKQLSGEISPVEEEQGEDTLVKADFALSELGSMGGGPPPDAGTSFEENGEALPAGGGGEVPPAPPGGPPELSPQTEKGGGAILGGSVAILLAGFLLAGRFRRRY